MRVNIYISLDIDPEEYPVPSDGRLSEELEEKLESFFYDDEGITIKKINVIEKG